MVDVAEIERAIAGKPDAGYAAVPVSLMRAIVRELRGRDASLAQLAAASAIGDLGESLTR